MKKVDICICPQPGMDGSMRCAATPHKHKLRKVTGSSSMGTSSIEVTACDNHVQVYLSLDFQEIAQMACSRCCTNQAGPDGYCEPCAEALDRESLESKSKNDATRLKEVGYCLNRDLVHGCLTYTEVGSQYCSHCTNYMKLAGTPPPAPSNDKPRVKVRPIPSSARHCILTVGCAGTMVGSVRRFSRNSREELWWTCEICKAEKLAERTWAIPDPNVTAAQLEAIEDQALEMQLRKEPTTTDMADMSEAIRQTVRGFNQGNFE